MRARPHPARSISRPRASTTRMPYRRRITLTPAAGLAGTRSVTGCQLIPGCADYDPYAPFEQSDGHGDPGLTNEFVPQLAALAEDGRMGRDQRRLVLQRGA